MAQRPINAVQLGGDNPLEYRIVPSSVVEMGHMDPGHPTDHEGISERAKGELEELLHLAGEAEHERQREEATEKMAHVAEQNAEHQKHDVELQQEKTELAREKFEEQMRAYEAQEEITHMQHRSKAGHGHDMPHSDHPKNHNDENGAGIFVGGHGDGFSILGHKKHTAESEHSDINHHARVTHHEDRGSHHSSHNASGVSLHVESSSPKAEAKTHVESPRLEPRGTPESTSPRNGGTAPKAIAASSILATAYLFLRNLVKPRSSRGQKNPYKGRASSPSIDQVISLE